MGSSVRLEQNASQREMMMDENGEREREARFNHHHFPTNLKFKAIDCITLFTVGYSEGQESLVDTINLSSRL